MTAFEQHHHNLFDRINAQPLREDNLSLEERRELIQNFGKQSSAYFTLQEGVHHFGIPGIGFVAYFVQKSLFHAYNICFTRPVCADENLELLIQYTERYTGRKTLFLAIDKATADALVRCGYKCNEMGTEFEVLLDRFQLKGKEMKQLRWASNFNKRGFEVREQPWSEIDAAEVEDISHEWRQTKVVKNAELKLLTRPPEYKDTWLVRKFYCYRDNKLVGFIFFDPYFENGRIVGYCANILRGRKDVKPSGFLDFILLEAIKQFRKEGVEKVSLGMAPLYQIQKHTHEVTWARHLQLFMFEHCGFLYAFKPLAYHKTRYRAEQQKWYQCSKGVNGLKAALLTMLATNVF